MCMAGCWHEDEDANLRELGWSYDIGAAEALGLGRRDSPCRSGIQAWANDEITDSAQALGEQAEASLLRCDCDQLGSDLQTRS
jgi:hypothetical protein